MSINGFFNFYDSFYYKMNCIFSIYQSSFNKSASSQNIVNQKLKGHKHRVIYGIPLITRLLAGWSITPYQYSYPYSYDAAFSKISSPVTINKTSKVNLSTSASKVTDVNNTVSSLTNVNTIKKTEVSTTKKVSSKDNTTIDSQSTDTSNYKSAMQEVMSRSYPIVIGNQFHAKDINTQLAQKIAKTLDLVIINKTDDLFVDKGASTNLANQLHSYNPNIKVLQYLNLIDVWDNNTSSKWIKNNNALLYDDSGKAVHPYEKYYGNSRLAADSTNVNWQNYYAEHAKSIVDQGMDGIFSDNWFRSNAQGWNVSGDRFAQLQQGWETIGQKTKAAIGDDKILIGNSPAYNTYQSRDASMIERRNAPNTTAFNNYLKWSDEAAKYGQANLDTMSWIDNKSYISSVNSVLEFSLPACLLTDNIFGVPNNNEVLAIIEKVGKLGRPNGSRYRKDNVLQRDFTEGKVLFNDTSSSKTITLPPNKYKDVDGNPITTVTLDSFKGIILKV